MHVEDSDCPVSHQPPQPPQQNKPGKRANFLCCCASSMSLSVNQSVNQSFPGSTKPSSPFYGLIYLLTGPISRKFMSIRILQNQNARAAAISRLASTSGVKSGFWNFELACMSLSSDRSCHPLHRSVHNLISMEPLAVPVFFIYIHIYI